MASAWSADEETEEEDCVDNGFRTSPMRFWYPDLHDNKCGGSNKKHIRSEVKKKCKSIHKPVCMHDVICPRCGIGNQSGGPKVIKKNGFDKNRCQIFFCNNCRRGFSSVTSVTQTPCKSDKEIKRGKPQKNQQEEHVFRQLQATPTLTVQEAKGTNKLAHKPVSMHDLMCPRCGLNNQSGDTKMIKKNGFDKYRRQLFFCNNCRRGFSSATLITQTPCKKENTTKHETPPEKLEEQQSESIICKFRQLCGMPTFITQKIRT